MSPPPAEKAIDRADVDSAPFRRRAALRDGDRLAAVDLGTNNCRLLVAELQQGALTIVDSFSRIVRLGEGLAASERLSDTAMARTLSALRVCSRIIDRHQVADLRCVATEACRRAINGDGFLERIRRVTGLRFDLLDHDEEARLAMLGCLPLLDPAADHVLVLDIGGGSTEIMWLDRCVVPDERAPGRTLSLPLGVVTLSESVRGGPDGVRYPAMVEAVEAALGPAASGWPALTPALEPQVQMLGTSGTVTTLAALHLGLRRYDRRKVDGLDLPFVEVKRLAGELRAQDDAARAANPCIGEGRADLVVAGCAILEAVHRRWPVRRLKVADRGLREGILSALCGHGLEEALKPAAPDRQDEGAVSPRPAAALAAARPAEVLA